MGPLAGIKIVEFAGIGPGPLCGMMLADMGADVIRIDRARPVNNYPGEKWDSYNPGKFGLLNRGKRSVALNLKNAAGVEATLALIEKADGVIDPFRPGVLERLGLGPEVCLERSPALIYGRMTGWGQDGPLAQAAGHDANYIAIAGALNLIGRPGEKPYPPLNYVGDYGGGACMLAFGMACGFYEARGSGKGQVIDTAMSEGAAILTTMMYGIHAAGGWNEKGKNRIDGGAHFYDTYETSDARYITIACAEPHFYELLLDLLEISPDDELRHERMNPDNWPAYKARFEAIFKTRTQAEWDTLLEGTDVCYAPVLDFDEAPKHPHNVARKAFIEIDGVTQPAPAPRFSRTPSARPSAPPLSGQDNDTALAAWGVDSDAIEAFSTNGAFTP